MTKHYIVLQWEDSFNEKYPHIVHEERCKAYDIEQCESIVIADTASDKIEGWYLQ